MIGIDVTPLASPLTGIGTFVLRMVEALYAAPDLQPRLIALTGRSRSTLNAQLPNGVGPVGRSYPAAPLLAAWKRLPVPTAGMLFGPMDMVHGTNFYCPPAGVGKPELITIHDSGPWTRPAEVVPTARSFPKLAERAIGRGAHVHALSFTAGAELQDLLEIPSERMHPVPLAVDPVPYQNLSDRLAAELGESPFVLALGSIEPRKQFPELIMAVEPLLSRLPQLRLVVAGGPGGDSDRVRNTIESLGRARDQVIVPGYVTINERNALLHAAAVVMSAASDEGFGMVPLEAMTAGTPVIATRGGAQPEVCGAAAKMVDVGDWDGLREAITEVLENKSLQRQLVTAGETQAAKYSWESTTSQILDLYRMLLS